MSVVSSMVKVPRETTFKGCTSSFSPLKTPRAPRASIVTKVTCKTETNKQFGVGLAAAALAVAFGFGAVDSAMAGDLAGLTPCSESKAFDKQKKKEVKGLMKRQKLYEKDSAPYLALQATIDRTENRFANYAEAGLLCGAEGYPHLIADPGMALKYGHAGEVFIPTIGFLYVAGYIGTVGRNYIQTVKKEKKPTEKEIIIDVPLALSLSGQGFAWPIQAVKELRNGTLTEKEENITVSPR
eukprot:TRINITY_DN1991_c0_g1_i4.p1 TRINITY_DN1991_c0_g1~~TRINITY_DN1991_c0_g1_i4.p1  ORF type:complete len:247 (-),score=62.39 TRINITY_DN1991_c0_g1_i4:133-852(-)